MLVSKKFLQSSLIYTVAGTLPMVSAIFLLPFYISYLPTSDFGALSIYMALSLFIQIMTMYSFDTSLYIHYHEYKHYPSKLASFTSSAFVMMLVIGASLVFILMMTGHFLFETIFEKQSISFYPYGLIAVVTGVFQALFKVHSNLLQSSEKPNLYLLSNLFSFSLIAGFTILGLYMYPGTLVGPLGGRLAAAIVTGSWVLGRIVRLFGIHFDHPLLRNSFSFNFYTFLYQLLQWVINYFDRIVMVFYLALAEVGVYDFAVKCMLVVEFLLSGLHSAFYPKVVSLVMALKTKGSSQQINRYYHGYTIVNLLLICFSILALPLLVDTFVHKPSYRESTVYLPFIALVYIFRSMRQFFLAPYGILKYTKPLPIIYLVVSFLKIFFIVLLVDRMGIFGVITASVISAIAETALLYIYVRGKFRFRLNVLKIVIMPLVIFSMILILEPLFGDEAPVLLHVAYVVTCLGLLWAVYRREIGLLNLRSAL